MQKTKAIFNNNLKNKNFKTNSSPKTVNINPVTGKPFFKNPNRVSINNQIRALEMRVIDQNGQNLGVISKEEALGISKSLNLDLIEVSNNVNPPICKIADYGKHTYEQSKKLKTVKAKQVISETKNIQLSIGIGENDMNIRSKQTAEWLKEGHRVKIELKLKGREKYLDEKFLRERLDRMLTIIPVEYKIAEPIKKMPKGFMIVLEQSK